MIPNKVCPVVFRIAAAGREILAFEHPLAGCQLVKGTIEPGEAIEAAALRELAEESGVEAVVARHLGIWASGYEGQIWAFVECTAARPLPDSWSHHTTDGGGHIFRFFWHHLGEPVDPDRWHPLFRGAVEFVEAAG